MRFCELFQWLQAESTCGRDRGEGGGKADLTQSIVFSVGHIQAVPPCAVGHALRPVEGGRLKGAVAEGGPVAANLVQETTLQIAHHNPAAK